jgi:CRISPR-associated protein Csm3
MKLLYIKPISGKITLLSGLHIGADDTEMHIGGTDSPVVTHPHTREPYIPGSSIKGKVRSLLEMRTGLMANTDGKPLNAKILKNLKGDERKAALAILQIFGTSGADGEDAKQIGQARASFSDCSLSNDSKQLAEANNWPYMEVKSENSINRIKGTAESPRFMERVIAGLSFDFTVSLKEMEGDGDLLDLLLEGLKMVELDALGGSGSRGYGRVQFEFADAEIQQQFTQIQFT